MTFFKLEQSDAYFNMKACFAWGLWHDPESKKEGSPKNSSEALLGYRRLLELYNERGKLKPSQEKGWYGFPMEDKPDKKGVVTFAKNRIRALSKAVKVLIGIALTSVVLSCTAQSPNSNKQQPNILQDNDSKVILAGYFDYDSLMDTMFELDDVLIISLAASETPHTMHKIDDDSESMMEVLPSVHKGEIRLAFFDGAGNDNQTYIVYSFDSLANDWFQTKTFFMSKNIESDGFHAETVEVEIFDSTTTEALINKTQEPISSSIFHQKTQHPISLADSLRHDPKYEASIFEVAEMIVRYPIGQNIESYNNIAYHILEKGDYSTSLFLLEKVLMVAPERMVAYLNAADAFWLAENTSKASELYSIYRDKMEAKGFKHKIPKRVFDRTKLSEDNQK